MPLVRFMRSKVELESTFKRGRDDDVKMKILNYGWSEDDVKFHSHDDPMKMT